MGWVIAICLVISVFGIIYAQKDKKVGIPIIVFSILVFLSQAILGEATYKYLENCTTETTTTTTTTTTTSNPTTPTAPTDPTSPPTHYQSDFYVGQTITFGRFDCDGLERTGAEDLEWTVLSVEGNKALVITSYIIDSRMYSDTPTANWSSCRLRRWLNSNFYDKAFSDSEKSAILLTDVTNSDNPEHGTPGGSNTRDYVFLLSAYEAELYMDYDADRVGLPTQHAIADGAWRAGFWWWLRTPGITDTNACYVKSKGGVSYEGDKIYGQGGVRPVMYIDTSAL